MQPLEKRVDCFAPLAMTPGYSCCAQVRKVGGASSEIPASRNASAWSLRSLNFAEKLSHHVRFNVIRIIQTCQQTTSIFETMRAAKPPLSN
jgi:hypothetical protein